MLFILNVLLILARHRYGAIPRPYQLKPGGVMFVSFKLRAGEWEQDGRFFNGYSENSFRELVKKHPSFGHCSIWTTDDVRPDRKDEKWLNALIR